MNARGVRDVHAVLETREPGEPLFSAVHACWICDHHQLTPFHAARLDFHDYAAQDPGLDSYTGERVWLARCAHCGFAQPEKLPTLPRFFDRMYDQHWSDAWIAGEFDSRYKDFIFTTILRELDRRTRTGQRRLLDVGAHAGRFLHLAQRDGWAVEGIELNPRTAAYAAARTGATVHQVNATALASRGRRYDAVVLTDVLEHIPAPLDLLRSLRGLLAPGGTLAIKVPCGTSQWHKERALARLRPGRPVSLADNLVHVNHFTPRSLRLALERAGFVTPDVRTAAPELLPIDGWSLPRMGSNVIRLAVYAAARVPGAVRTPLALHLQAFAQVPE